jgi:hypothetical protein
VKDGFWPTVSFNCYSARAAFRIPPPVGPSRLSQTRTGFTRVDPAQSDRLTAGSNPTDSNLAKQSDLGAQRQTRIESPIAWTKDCSRPAKDVVAASMRTVKITRADTHMNVQTCHLIFLRSIWELLACQCNGCRVTVDDEVLGRSGALP